MRQISGFVFVGMLLLVLLGDRGAVRATERSSARERYFETRVRPILQQCVRCHGKKARGGLDLRSRTSALKGGDSGSALHPGNPARSLLLKRVLAGEMPPKQPLKAAEREVLRQWIASGAVWKGTLREETSKKEVKPRWALQPLRQPAVPDVEDAGWVRNPIDAFILARLEREGLQPNRIGDPQDERAKRAWLRRVTFDLTGLPPTPEEIAGFLADRAIATSPLAHEKVVDRLLASPAYGERWARHWLDVARFGESQGFERDKIRPNAWRYRDYVIRAFNRDLPYPQFVREQLAGDILSSAESAHQGRPGDGVIATGFLVGGPYDEVGHGSASISVRLRTREEELEDILATVGQTFLGMTINCARCHDHKFDPIPQKDYYRLKAVFEGVKPGDRGMFTPEELRQRQSHQEEVHREIHQLLGRLAALKQLARQRLHKSGTTSNLREKQKQDRGPATRVPSPLACWTFETDTRDQMGAMPGTLHGGAKVERGRLLLSGRGAYLATAPLPRTVRERTLEAWVSLSNLTQRGGGVISLQTKGGRVFDAIVFGERQPRHWMAGSDYFRRTRPLGGPAETTGPGGLVHVAIVYSKDNRITFYRNGEVYGKGYVPKGQDASLRTFAGGNGHVLLGLRHTGAGNGFLAGEIEEARLYDRALTAEQIAASYRAGETRMARLRAALTSTQRKELAQIRERLQSLHQRLRTTQQNPLVYAVKAVNPPSTHLLIRGNPQKKGARVKPGALSAVDVAGTSGNLGLKGDAPEGVRRVKFARWVTHPDNPLTARVLVNRIWHYHFGRGIVATPSDFGFNGARPTHPALLDWLATEFTNTGSSIKKLHRLIVLSATYRQGSTRLPRATQRDAGNRLLWRFPPRRLEGEAIRDAMLAISGRLNTQMRGPSYQPFTVKVFNSHFYILKDRADPAYERRTIYRMNVNSARSPLLESLDCPDPSTRTPRRSLTTTPLQALGLMNNSFVLRQAHSFGQRVVKKAGKNPKEQVQYAYLLALGRKPTLEELADASELVRKHGVEHLCWALFNASEFLYLR